MMEFFGDFDAVNALLSDMSARLYDTTPAMRAIGLALEKSTRLRFRDTKGPDGQAWPMSERARLGKEGGATLTRTGHMRNSITSEATRTSVRVGSAGVPYAPYHQFGARIGPHVIRAKPGKALYWPGAKHPVKKVNHPGSVLPIRAILGLSETDERKIERVVLHHLENGS